MGNKTKEGGNYETMAFHPFSEHREDLTVPVDISEADHLPQAFLQPGWLGEFHPYR